MKRKIKYRVWIEYSKTMVTEANDVIMPYIHCDGSAFISYDLTDVTEDITVLQYTGLQDSNGVEIYEGDIVKLSYDNSPVDPSFYAVQFREGVFGINVPAEFRELRFYCSESSQKWAVDRKVVVVGNIFENKEIDYK